MVSRKGELSPAGVDRGWPYQVALPEEQCTSKNYEIHASFNKGRSLCLRGHSVGYAGIWYRVFCYSVRDDAEAFIARFGGEWFDPKLRGKGANWMRYNGTLTGQKSAGQNPPAPNR
jgi:hypothetical protein